MTKQISVACNFGSAEFLDEVVSATCDLEGIVSYTIGPALTHEGLLKVVRKIRKQTDKSIVLDQQRTITSSSVDPQPILNSAARSGINAIVLAHVPDLKANESWIKEAHKRDLCVKSMPELYSEAETKNGQNPKMGVADMIMQQVADLGVSSFMLQGESPWRVSYYLNAVGKLGIENPALHFTRAADPESQRLCPPLRMPALSSIDCVALVGRAIYGGASALDIRQRAEQLTANFAANGS